MSSPKAVLIVFTAWAIVSLAIIMLMLPSQDRFGAFLFGSLVSVYWMLYGVLERATLRSDEPGERSSAQYSRSAMTPVRRLLTRDVYYGGPIDKKGGNTDAG